MLYIHGMNGRKYLPGNAIHSSPEFSTLPDMYGQPIKTRLLLDIFNTPADSHVVQSVHNHLQQHNLLASSLRHLFSCNQEQERELEQELEEERQVERPPPCLANSTAIRPCIKKLLTKQMDCCCETPCWEPVMNYISNTRHPDGPS